MHRLDPDGMAGLRRDTFRDDLDDCGPIPLDALIWIKNRIDPTLTFRRSCREGVCGSCAMTIDATNWTACTWAIADRAKPATIFLLANLPAIKELVPDQTHLLAQYEMIEPWLNPGRAIAEIKKKMIERQG
ncbi:2Fe-2S iron-sulfur cluster-binding protein [Paracoccus denitrificans]|nr:MULTISPECIES: 2Fe-2S iron-sulfur cluster-binding protein [Paracoccus]MCU7429352.1 2Fe-2S iron-sulfur cluster-binding protein [Paracoccus denitrificans]MDK8873340.1 2Fe-2S iron-sulfur cluster-binding protein [Paracoccus sp. SSJ]